VIQSNIREYVCETFVCETSAFRPTAIFHTIDDYFIFLMLKFNVINIIRCAAKKTTSKCISKYGTRAIYYIAGSGKKDEKDFSWKCLYTILDILKI